MISYSFFNRLVETHLSLLSAEFSKLPCYQNLWQAVKKNEALLKRLKDRGTSSQVGWTADWRAWLICCSVTIWIFFFQATVLQSTENPNKWLVIGNTHLYFHPDADHIRLLQGGQTILFIEDIVNKLKEAVSFLLDYLMDFFKNSV